MAVLGHHTFSYFDHYRALSCFLDFYFGCFGPPYFFICWSLSGMMLFSLFLFIIHFSCLSHYRPSSCFLLRFYFSNFGPPYFQNYFSSTLFFFRRTFIGWFFLWQRLSGGFAFDSIPNRFFFTSRLLSAMISDLFLSLFFSSLA